MKKLRYFILCFVGVIGIVMSIRAHQTVHENTSNEVLAGSACWQYTLYTYNMYSPVLDYGNACWERFPIPHSPFYEWEFIGFDIYCGYYPGSGISCEARQCKTWLENCMYMIPN